MGVGRTHHALSPPVVCNALEDLRAGAVEPVERLSMYTDEQEQQIEFRMEIVSLRTQGKSVTLDQLTKLAADAEAFSKQSLKHISAPTII